MRDAMRSISTVVFSALRSALRDGGAAAISAIAVWRKAAADCARSGLVSQLRSRRLPAPVQQPSRSE
jgi:hypothetical protein